MGCTECLGTRLCASAGHGCFEAFTLRLTYEDHVVIEPVLTGRVHSLPILSRSSNCKPLRGTSIDSRLLVRNLMEHIMAHARFRIMQ